MTVAFIGPKKFERTVELIVRMWEVIAELVVDDGANVFLFTNESFYDYNCWAMVSQLKMHHPNIRRIHMRKDKQKNKYRLEGTRKSFEKRVLLNSVRNAGMFAEFVRNRAMVDKCDVLVVYCDTSCVRMPRIKDETETVMEYALQMNKRVINLFEK